MYLYSVCAKINKYIYNQYRQQLDVLLEQSQATLLVLTSENENFSKVSKLSLRL